MRKRQKYKPISPANGTDPMTLEEVAASMGVTRERVRQIEVSALRKLRHVLIQRGILKPYDLI